MVSKRNYKKEYAEFHSKPKQKKRRAQRNKTIKKMFIIKIRTLKIINAVIYLLFRERKIEVN